MSTAPTRLSLGERDVCRVIDVFCEAFADYPVMRYVLGEDAADDGFRLRTLIRLFVMARVFRLEVLLGIEGDAGLEAAALVSFAAAGAHPPEFDAFREVVWAELGAPARARYAHLGEVWAPFEVDIPHIHLNMIGVRAGLQGKGLARRLLDHVHRMSRDHPASQGVTLTTEDPANVPMYEHCGYRVVGHTRVSPELATWGFFRPD